MIVDSDKSRRPLRRIAHLVLIWVLFLVGCAASVVLAIVVMFGLAPAFQRLGTYVAAAVLLQLTLLALVLWPILRNVGGKIARALLVSVATLTASAFVDVTVVATHANPQGYVAPPALPRMAYWQLPTGSHLAYTRIAAEGTASATPIVFLHGGPGWFITDSDVQFYGQLAHDGFDVYLFDQWGSGRSDLADDVRAYTTQRYVDDLDAMREQLQAKQLILIGQSWGATLAADYAAAFPQQVEKIIFISPGALWDVRRFHPDYSATADIPESGDGLPLSLYAAMLLSARGPALAQQILGQRELQAVIAGVPGEQQLSQNYCAGDEPLVPRTRISGANPYVNRRVFADQDSFGDPRPRLRKSTIPVLVLRGACDFLPEAIANEYSKVFSNSRIKTLEHAGHALYEVKGSIVLGFISEFLLGH